MAASHPSFCSTRRTTPGPAARYGRRPGRVSRRPTPAHDPVRAAVPPSFPAGHPATATPPAACHGLPTRHGRPGAAAANTVPPPRARPRRSGTPWALERDPSASRGSGFNAAAAAAAAAPTAACHCHLTPRVMPRAADSTSPSHRGCRMDLGASTRSTCYGGRLRPRGLTWSGAHRPDGVTRRRARSMVQG